MTAVGPEDGNVTEDPWHAKAEWQRREVVLCALVCFRGMGGQVVRVILSPSLNLDRLPVPLWSI